MSWLDLFKYLAVFATGLACWKLFGRALFAWTFSKGILNCCAGPLIWLAGATVSAWLMYLLTIYAAAQLGITIHIAEAIAEFKDIPDLVFYMAFFGLFGLLGEQVGLVAALKQQRDPASSAEGKPNKQVG